MESLVSAIPAGDGKIYKFFLQCTVITVLPGVLHWDGLSCVKKEEQEEEEGEGAEMLLDRHRSHARHRFARHPCRLFNLQPRIHQR
jgi:hypothetical protein